MKLIDTSIRQEAAFMPNPLGNVCNGDYGLCIDITHASANNGELWRSLKNNAQNYPITGSYYHRDSTYIEFSQAGQTWVKLTIRTSQKGNPKAQKTAFPGCVKTC